MATKRKPEEDDDVGSALQAGQKEKKSRKHGRGRSRSRKVRDSPETPPRKVRDASETPPRNTRRKIMFDEPPNEHGSEAVQKKGKLNTKPEVNQNQQQQVNGKKRKEKEGVEVNIVTLKPEEVMAIQTNKSSW